MKATHIFLALLLGLSTAPAAQAQTPAPKKKEAAAQPAKKPAGKATTSKPGKSSTTKKPGAKTTAPAKPKPKDPATKPPAPPKPKRPKADAKNPVVQLNTDTTEVYFRGGCNFKDEAKPGVQYLMEPSKEAEAIVTDILKEALMDSRNFQLRVGGEVENARATEANGTRYLLYSQRFLSFFKAQAKTKWAATFVLAHEVGHLNYNHLLVGHTDNKDTLKILKNNELQADRFAATALARMGATLEETLAAIDSFALEGETATHPKSETRRNAITLAYEKEAQPKELSIGACPGSRDISIKPTSEIDSRRVTVRYTLPPTLNGHRFKVCLFSDDTLVARKIRTVSGTGESLPFKTSPSPIVWKYYQDGLERSILEQPDLLQVCVFDMNNLPRPMPKWNKTIFISSEVLSGAAFAYGLVQMADGWGSYQRYKNITDKNDPIYQEGESRQQRYDLSDDKWVKGQKWACVGLISAGITTWLWCRTAKKYRQPKNMYCAEPPPRIQVEPLFATGGWAGLGLRASF